MDYWFELRANQVELGTVPWDNPPATTRFIGSIAPSPIHRQTIKPFHMGQFRKIPLVRCFEPITIPLRLGRFLRTRSPAATFLTSTSPHLDDIFLAHVTPAYNTWEYGGTRIQAYPQLHRDYRCLWRSQPALLSLDTGFPAAVPYDSPGYVHEGRNTDLYEAGDNVRSHITGNTSRHVLHRCATAFLVR